MERGGQLQPAVRWIARAEQTKLSLSLNRSMPFQYAGCEDGTRQRRYRGRQAPREDGHSPGGANYILPRLILLDPDVYLVPAYRYKVAPTRKKDPIRSAENSQDIAIRFLGWNPFGSSLRQ